ncbi:MAG: hypothetical protein FD163_2531 [Hyphomonadaceae bacterium]|nr:MAG: hypothetical protein FD163_2531 [Hyphomonadaceae bacterium]
MSEFLAIGKIGADLGFLCEVVDFDTNAGNPSAWLVTAKLRKAKSVNDVPTARTEDVSIDVQFTPATVDAKANFSFSVSHSVTANLEIGTYCVIPQIIFANGQKIKDGPFYIQLGEG